MDSDEKTLPEGVQPYDRINGVRIGALAGGVLGIVPAWIFWPAFGWVLAGAAVGGLAGYLYQRREEGRPPNA